MKVVLDTNVWLSGIFWKGEAHNLINNCFDKKIEIIISKDILNEIIGVVNREEKFSKHLKDKKESIEELIRTILSISQLIETKTKLDIVKVDPKDNIILEVAFDGKVDYIITYDSHLLNMFEFREIKILNPGEFLKELK